MASLFPALRSCPRPLSPSGLPHPNSSPSLAFWRPWHHLIRARGEEHPTCNTSSSVGDRWAFTYSKESPEGEEIEKGKNKRSERGNLARGVWAGRGNAKIGMPMWGKSLTPLERGPSPSHPKTLELNRNGSRQRRLAHHSRQSIYTC